MNNVRANLLARRDEILRRKTTVVERLVDDVPDRLGDSIDISTDEQTGATELQLETRLAHELVEIDAALGRLDDGTYGECEDCADQIGARRLEAQPLARLCVECQEARENDAKRRYKRPGLLDEFE